MSRATLPASAPSRATSMTAAPAAASARAAPSPRPRLAPVTRATFPFNSLDTGPPASERIAAGAISSVLQVQPGETSSCSPIDTGCRSAPRPRRARRLCRRLDCVLSAAHGDLAHLARAIEADPDFALAHAALARARFLMADVAGARQSAAAPASSPQTRRRASKAISTRSALPSRASRSRRWPRRAPISPSIRATPWSPRPPPACSA